MKKAVFLDRDGTTNRDLGYIGRADQFHLLPRVSQAIKLLNQNQYKVIVVTNQSGIARGLFSKENVEKIHKEMKVRLAREGAYIDTIYYCPHHPTEGNSVYTINCKCRKPEIGMLLQAAKDFNLDLRASFIIGDKIED